MSIALVGSSSYRIQGDFATVTVDRVENNSQTRTSGTLRLELWALEAPYAGSGPVRGFKLVENVLDNDSRPDERLAPGEFYFDISFTDRLQVDLPNGDYALTLFVTEFTGDAQNDGFSIADFGNFQQGLRVGPIIDDSPPAPIPDVEAPPVDPDPFDPAPVDPTPVDPTPIDPTPIDPGPTVRLGDSGRNLIRGDAGDDLIRGFGGNDRLIGRGGDDKLIGGGGRDTLSGGGGQDTLAGGGGDDRLIGGGGADTVKGGGGRDILLGRRGEDVLIGGRGNDTLLGGGDRDVFVFSGGHGFDVIRDFEVGVDMIQLRGGAADFQFISQNGQAALTFAGGGVVFSGVAAGQIDEGDIIF